MFPEPARLTLAELAAMVGGRAAGDVDKLISGVTSLTQAGPSDLGLLVDSLGVAMVTMVSLVAALVHLYSIGYMRGDSSVPRFFSYLSLFTYSC